MKAFRDKELEKARKNRIKNRPIIIMTYIMVLVFVGMFSYIIYFMYSDADIIVANSSNKRQDSFDDFVIRGDIVTSDGTVVATSEVSDDGTETRRYPYGGLFAHTVGYNEYGRSGVELSENFELMRSHVNILEKVSDDLGDDKHKGDTVVLTLDYELQKKAAETLGNARGAVVVLDADTSDVLVMYSSPTFDPNNIGAVWDQVHSDEGSESSVLLNRATQGMYAPGSTFKVVTALEYMKEHKDYEKFSHNCGGSDIFNSVSIRCSNSTAHGELDLTGALAKSCNTSFADIGTNEISMDKLNKLTEELLFNKELPYDGNHSKSQFKVDGDSDKSQIPQTVIGQGDTLITPLHNALIMQSIANGGLMMKPRIVKGLENANGLTLSFSKPKAYGTVVDGDLARQIIPMLEEVCKTGTAAQFMSNKSYTVAGKTGTAEYDNNGNCNSWFVGFTNVNDPDIVVSVIVEDYTSNQISGTYVASQIMDQYYKNVSTGY